MINKILGKKTLIEKILIGVSMLMTFTFYISIPCGVAWIISLFGIHINYLIPAGIGLFCYLFVFVMALFQYIQVKKISNSFEDEWNKYKF